MIISPSILSADFMNLQNDVDVLKDEKDLWLHLDVMDGHFVPNMTFGIPIINQLSKITDIPLDVHLMVTNPSFHIIELKDIPIKNITFHLEAVKDADKLINMAKEFYPSIGLSIRPNTPVSDISLEVLMEIDLILVMSVEPGFGGQSFMPNALDKIKELVKLRDEHALNFVIQVDGGINEDTAKQCSEAGADNLVAGSYIFKNKQSQYKEKINSLR